MIGIESILQNPALNMWIGISGLVLALIGIVLTLKYRKIRRISYAIAGVNLFQDISNKQDGLEVSYRGKLTENVTRTTIILWNSGNTTIKSDDIAKSNVLKIVAKKGVAILDCRVIQTNEPTNQFNIEEPVFNPKNFKWSGESNDDFNNDFTDSRYIKFDFIDRNEGCVIQIIHNGKSLQDISIQGKIQGGKIKKNKLIVQEPGIRVVLFSFLSVTISLTVFAILEFNSDLAAIILLIWIVLLFVLPMCLFYYFFAPKKLDIFFKEVNINK